MFSKNHKVSVRQMRRLLVLDLFSGTGLLLPLAVGRLSGTSGIFAIFLGGAGAGVFSIFLLKLVKCFKTGYPSFCEYLLGHRGAQILMGIYSLKYFVSAALLLGVFAQIINHTFLTDIPEPILGSAMLVVCIYCVFKGLETRARLGEMLVYLVIVPIILIIVASLSQIHLDRLWPISFLTETDMGKTTPGSGGLAGFLWAVFITFSMFSVIEWLLFLRPNVNKMEDAGKGAIMSILWPVLLNILILIVCIGIFSVEGMNNESWPTVTLMQIVRFPGGFISRQDGLMLAFWMIGMFMLIGGNIYYGMESFKAINSKLRKPWIIVIPGALILVCFLGIYVQDAARIFMSYMSFVYMPLTVSVPVILKCIYSFTGKDKFGRKKQNKVNSSEKKVRLRSIILLFICSLGLCGCHNFTEIEDRNFVMCLGIDTSSSGLEVSFGFPDLKALTGDGDNIHYPAVTISGDCMEVVEKSYAAQSNKKLDYGQLQMIVFGRNMLEDEQRMRQVLEYIKENQKFTRTVLVCMADQRASDIVALDEDVNGSIGVYLRQMFDNNSPNYQLTVGDLIVGLSLEEEITEIAVVTCGNQVPEIIDTEKITGFFLIK